ncbi:MAG TPA: hypothetical protein V6D33_11710 [Cyanophyceae cyanobacterium]
MSATLTVAELAEEINLTAPELLPLVSKMGLKNATESTKVPPAIADSARIAAKSRNNVVALPQAKAADSQGGQPKSDGDLTVSRKLKLSEIKDISKASGLSQSVVRGLDQALHNREMQIAFLEGYQAIERQKQLKAALETGRVAAQLQDLKAREQALEEREQELLEEGLSESVHPTAIAEALGIDLDGLLSGLQESTEKRMVSKMSQSDAIAKINNGQEPTAEELANPFVLLAYNRSKRQ